jgi:uncharacterized protein YjbI with pentapeptide repeats
MEASTVSIVVRRTDSDLASFTSVGIAAVALLVTLGGGHAAGQEFAGFRYYSGKCVNDEGEEGKNPGWVGECGGLRAHDLRNAILNEVDLSGADLHAAQARGVKLKDAVLVGATMRNAELESADLRGADLTDAVMDRADLHLADLTGAKLQGARLERVRLVDAVLRDADLSRANLRLADLRGADLAYADLSRANLRGAMYNRRTVLPVTLTPQLAQVRGMVFRP